MRRLFDHNESWTTEATELGREVRAALKPIVQKLVDDGVDSHDIESVVILEAQSLVCELRLRAGVERRKVAKAKGLIKDAK